MTVTPATTVKSEHKHREAYEDNTVISSSLMSANGLDDEGGVCGGRQSGGWPVRVSQKFHPGLASPFRYAFWTKSSFNQR